MIHILTAVEKINCDVTSIQKSLLMLFANFSNKDGEAIISSKRICSSVRCGRSTFFRHISKLQEAGWIKVEKRSSASGSNLSSLYRLNLAKIDEVTKSKTILQLAKSAIKKIVDAFKSFLTKEKIAELESDRGVVKQWDGDSPKSEPHKYINNNTSNKYNNYSTREYKGYNLPPRPQPKLYEPAQSNKKTPMPEFARDQITKLLKNAGASNSSNSILHKQGEIYAS